MHTIRYGRVTTQAPWINDVTGIKRCTPLLFATAHGYEETVQYLLSHVDVDINLQDKDGRTALFVASQIGHEGIVKSLIPQVCRGNKILDYYSLPGFR